VTPDPQPVPTGHDRAALVRILRGAALDVALLGHAKGRQLPADDSRCAATAIALSAAARGHHDGAVCTAQAEACYSLLAATVQADPMEWNDRPGTTAADVVTALRAAARRAATA
jgi:hypothetical protein